MGQPVRSKLTENWLAEASKSLVLQLFTLKIVQNTPINIATGRFL